MADENNSNEDGQFVPDGSMEPLSPQEADNTDYGLMVGERVQKKDLQQEMRESYLAYAMSVIVDRALPDVRDGMKPVHRRVIYAMYDGGYRPDRGYSKCARVVGEVMGKYHPHGDSAIYDTLVRMAQSWSMRYTLVDGQGNFGSPGDDPAAAMRYTECRMAPLAMEMVRDIDKDTVDFLPNYDGKTQEPTVLPARFPNLLCNGSSGIAVGMATNIPPHNMREVAEGVHWALDHPDASREELLENLIRIIKGPDFPTGAIIMGSAGIRQSYETGRGSITVRAKAHVESTKTGRSRLVFTEIPYMVNKARLIENIADLVKEKRIEGISDLNDETNRKGMRIVVDIRKDANAQVILNQLYQYTQLQDTVGVIMLAIDHKVPKVLTLKQMLQKYVEFQDEVVRRRTQYDLKKAKERAHILEGLKKATDIVDELIATIRACKGGMAEAKAAIMEQFGFDDPQADAIVKLQLGRLAGLEILKIEEELASLQAKIEDWEAILADDARVLAIVKDELLDMKKRFGDERRTEIQSVTGEVDIEDLIAEEQCVYTLTEAGYIKRQLKATYQAQKRGGRGISGMTRKEEDIVQEMFVGSTHDYVLFVTDKGRLFRIKGYTIAEGSRTSKGSNIVNLLQLAEGEKVTNMICQSKDADTEGGFVTMVTKQGLIKRTPLEQYANIRKSGLIGIALNEGDALAWTRLTSGHDMLIVATRNGQAIRFNEEDARPMGRSGHGVRAIKLAEGDEVVGVCICRENATILTVTENGKGRRSDIDTYRITARGGKGIRNYDASKDKVAAVKIVDDVDDVLLSSQEGIIIRLHANEIPVQSRYGSGVRVMRLGENDKVMVLARTDHDDEAQTESIEADTEDEPTAEQLAEMEAADEASAAEAPEADTGDEE